MVRQRQQRAAARHGDEAAEIARKLSSIQAGSGHNLSRLWEDWIHWMAITISNKFDLRPSVWQRREEEHAAIEERHGPEVVATFSEMMGMVAEALQENPADLLGGVYMALELGNDHAGQFFTPTEISLLMTLMNMDAEHLREIVERDGFVTVNDPAIGGGSTVFPVLAMMTEAGLNYAEQLHITGQDVDSRVLMMAYVQLSWLGVPAVLLRGDTLRMVFTDDWYTPAHILVGWGPRLRARRAREREAAEVGSPGESEPEREPESPIATSSPTTSEPIEPPAVAEPAKPAKQGSLFDGW